ncbi:polymorphic toxin-type HINT domain-containing protein, partial [Leptospira sp. 96542]|nr:polymorphic toxin-type HINT domain-containing protein [Leptospira sp. 96542]
MRSPVETGSSAGRNGEYRTSIEDKDLVSGDVALSADGRELVITDITIDERAETVYNFEVEEYHTYFVGEIGVWVHNDSYVVNLKDPDKSYVNLYGKKIQGKYTEKNGKGYLLIENDGFGNKLEYEFTKDGRVANEDGIDVYDTERTCQKSNSKGCTEGGIENRPNRVKINDKILGDGGTVEIAANGTMRVLVGNETLGDGFNILQENGQNNDVNDAINMGQNTRAACQGRTNCSVYHVFNATHGLKTDSLNSGAMQNLTQDDIRNNRQAYTDLVAKEPAMETLARHLSSGKVSILNTHSQGGAMGAIAITRANAIQHGSTSETLWIASGGAHTENLLPDAGLFRRGIFF